MQRKDLKPGLAITPMLASSAHRMEDLFKKMHGKPFVVEIKFDGERMLVRACGHDPE
jgi:ATP-dependent DNA ligase